MNANDLKRRVVEQTINISGLASILERNEQLDDAKEDKLLGAGVSRGVKNNYNHVKVDMHHYFLLSSYFLSSYRGIIRMVICESPSSASVHRFMIIREKLTDHFSFVQALPTGIRMSFY